MNLWSPTITEFPTTESTITLETRRLTVRQWGAGPPAIVILHDGLGSIEQWGQVPSAVAERTQLTVAAYDRSGHGQSTPVPSGPWPTDWLHREAEVLHDVLEHLGCEHPLVVGHSDGGSIALIHAATHGGEQATLTLAAHTWVEPVCFDAIETMRAASERIEHGLGRFHAHPAELFEAWSGVWTSPDFQRWDIRTLVGQIDRPVWIAQGTDDEYATPSHAVLSAEAVGSNARPLTLDGGRHLLHHHDPEMVIGLIVDFARELGANDSDAAG